MNTIEDYPILKRLPEAEREAYFHQAEAGEALTAEQAERLGLPLLAGVTLLPASGQATRAQHALFPGVNLFLKSVFQLAKEGAA